MASRVIANCGQLTLSWSGATRTWKNVYGVIGQPTLPAFDQALANTLDAALKGQFATSGLATLMSSLVILENTSIRSLNAASQPEFVGTAAPAAGAGVTDMLPLNVAACVTLRTSLAGKSFRGRTYLSGFDEAQNDTQGRIAAGANTAAVAFVQGIVAVLSAHGMTLAVLSFARDAHTIPEKVILGKGGFGTGVTGLVARNTKWESQRRRTGRE